LKPLACTHHGVEQERNNIQGEEGTLFLLFSTFNVNIVSLICSV